MSSLNTDSFALSRGSHHRSSCSAARAPPDPQAPSSSLAIFLAGKLQDRDRRISILQSKRPNRSQHGFVVSQNLAQVSPLLLRQSLAVFPNNVGELRFHVPALFRRQLDRRRFLL